MRSTRPARVLRANARRPVSALALSQRTPGAGARFARSQTWPADDVPFPPPSSKSLNWVFYQDLSRPDAPVVELLNDFDASYNFVDKDGPVFWFHTDLNAPHSASSRSNVGSSGKAIRSRPVQSSCNTFPSAWDQPVACPVPPGPANFGAHAGH